MYLGDNRYIKATKIGNVDSYFDAFGKQKEVNMSNVFYAEKMNTNLRPCETQISIFFKSTFKRLFGKRRTSSAPHT